MSNPPENKPLNLGKFNPSQTPQPPVESATSEGETMFIRRTTAAAVENNFDPVAQQTSEFGLPLKEMLGVITYCYARGVFNSGEIEDALELLYQAFPPELNQADKEKQAHQQASSRVHNAIWTDNKLPGQPLRD